MKLSEAPIPSFGCQESTGCHPCRSCPTAFNPRRNVALRTPQPKCGTVHMGCASNCRDPERSERGLVMNQRETGTSEQVLKFAPKEKAPNRVAQLDDAGQAIVAQIRTAADLAKEDCDRAMSLAHKLSMELRAAETEHSKWRGRLSTGETEQPAPNNGFGRSSKRLKRNYSLGDRSPARKRSQSVSLTVFVATFSRCRRYPFGTKSRDAYNSRRN